VTWNARLVRRAFGLLCLIVAVVMLVGGEMNPTPAVNPVAFAGYWLTCFGFALLALGAALLDLRAVRREARARQRRLLEDALCEIEVEKRRRQTGSQRPVANDVQDDLQD